MYAIYTLIDPRDNTIRYIGITDDVYARFLQHIRGMDENYAKSVWIQELRALNKMVIMETLEECETFELACERELYWIRHFEMLQEPLMNISKMSLPRKARKTNLRMGRHILLDMAQATVAAMGKPVARIEHQTVFEPQEPPKTRGEYNYEQAIAAWNAGYRSARDLAKALTNAGSPVGKDTALRIIKEMKSKNLI